MKKLVIILACVFLSIKANPTLENYHKNDKSLQMNELNNEVILPRLSIASKLEKIRRLLRDGNETLGIPVCDPFQLQYLEEEINIFNGLINGTGSLENLLFTGLSKYEIIEADISILTLKMSLKLKWPRLEGTSFYIINAFIKNKMIQVYGAGDFEHIAQDFQFETVVYFGLNSDNVYIKKMDTVISLRDFKFNITGLYYDDGISETLSVFISELVKQVIRDNQKNLAEVVNNFIIVNANNYLSKMTLKDLLDLLS